MLGAQRLGVFLHGEPLLGVGADCLQHSKAIAVPGQQALVRERLQPINRRTDDLLGAVDSPPTAEDCEPREQALLVGRQQPVAPVDRCSVA